MNLHPAEVPPRETDDYSSYAYQFDEMFVFKQLLSFSQQPVHPKCTLSTFYMP